MIQLFQKKGVHLLGAQRQIQAELDEYLANLREIALDMGEGFRAYLENDSNKFLQLFRKIDRLEGRMDTLRRNIEQEIYERRLLPDTRGDILGLLESLDKIPNRIQSTVRQLKLQKPHIPQHVHHSLQNLIARALQITEKLIPLVRAYLLRPAEVKDCAKELSDDEHEADLVEQEAMELCFKDESSELAHKMQLQDIIERVGSICDMAEDIGDRLMISSLKRLL